MNGNKFYYYDEKNDLAEYLERDEDTIAVWINPYLTLLFPRDKDLALKNVIGFQIQGMNILLENAEKQSATPLTENQKKQIEKLFMEGGWKYSIGNDGDKIWSKEK